MGSTPSRLSDSESATAERDTGAGADADALLPFPPEVVDHLLAPLSRADLASLLRVNSAFHAAVVWRMARRVRIIDGAAGNLKVEAYTEPRRGETSRVVKRFLPQWVDTVEVYPHSTAPCDQRDKERWDANWALLAPVKSLTSVRVVRVHFDDATTTLHTTPRSEAPDTLRCMVRIVPYMFSGHTVVHRNPGDDGTTLALGLRQVYVLGPGLVGTHGNHLSTLWIGGGQRTGQPAREITIVFAAPPRTEWWPVPTTTYTAWAPLREQWLNRLFDRLLVSLFEILGNPESSEARLLFVNAEAISLPDLDDMQQTALPGAWNTRQAHVEGVFRRRMATALPPNAARRAAVARAVSFVGMREWVAAGNWTGAFDYDEIAEWMPESEGAR